MTPSTVDECIVFFRTYYLSLYWMFLLECHNYIAIYFFPRLFQSSCWLKGTRLLHWCFSCISLTNKSMQIQKPTEWFFHVFKILWLLVYATMSQFSSCIHLVLGLKLFLNLF